MSSKLPVALARQALTKPWVAMKMFQGDNYLSRVPEHYKKFYWQWQVAPRTPVHYIPEEGNFKKLPSGVVQQVENVPVLLVQPKELHHGIWGGEAVVRGFKKKKKTLRRSPHYWVPTLKSTVLYSEILDRYMTITVTERTLKLVDEHYGFDNYILKTPPNDLMSQLAIKLKREMLLALAKGTLYPTNPAKKEELLEKYKEYIVSEEEAEWYGLTPKEAATKQKIIEEDIPLQPLKLSFRKEFIEYLENNKVELEEAKAEEAKSSFSSGSSWLSSVNPFTRKEK